VLGLGAGWHEREHKAYGFHFPPPGERVGRFREAVQILKSLFANERTTFEGRYYQLDDAAFMPGPVRPTGIPLVVGTRGARMLRTVAEYADIWNMVSGPDGVAETADLLREACAAVGRDPLALRWSIAAWPGRVGFDALAEPDRIADLVRAYMAQGISEVIFMWTNAADVAALERAAAAVETVRREVG
jgi:alkanesulfonate monooxygenase SsuD/methylene tetrahydromethanopterin reductase-like flavin-dependent oxidoreductase (luciferase family)